jgi:hypothetical protein
VVEELSRMDGSVGWCAMISTAGSFGAAFLDPAVAQRLCSHRNFSLAGQVVPSGRAELVKDCGPQKFNDGHAASATRVYSW